MTEKDEVKAESQVNPEVVMTKEKVEELTWYEKLRADEKVLDPTTKKEYVLLAGLWRLAMEKGITSTHVQVMQIPEDSNQNNATVIFEIYFNNGSCFSAVGHATPKNCRDDYRAYPITMAESRAKARACRDALGIQVCSAEERNEDADMQSQATSIQLQLIKILMGRKGVTQDDLLKSGTRKVANLEELTRIEAASTIEYLNPLPEKSKR